jgi:DNA polymerase-4
VEPASIDESYLDVTQALPFYGMTPGALADELRRRVRAEIGITISVGVSFCKIFAKMGSDYKKPDATTVITRDNYKQLLYPLPVREMLFVGSSAAQLLNRQGITTIGELAECPKERLHALLGKMGDTLWTYANGLDQSEVRCIGESDPVKSISNDVTFARDLLGEEDVKTGIMLLSDSVGTRMRQQQVKALTVQVRIKTPELKIISRQETLHSPTDSTKEIYHTAMGIMRRSWDMRRPIRMLSVGCTNFADNDAPEQLCMFESAAAPNREKQRRLDEAVDAIRHKFGKGSIAFGQTMKTDIGGVGDKTEE